MPGDRRPSTRPCAGAEVVGIVDHPGGQPEDLPLQILQRRQVSRRKGWRGSVRRTATGRRRHARRHPGILRSKAATAIPVPHRHAGTASGQQSPLPPMTTSPEAGCWTARAGTAAASWRRGRVPTRQWPAGPLCPGRHPGTRASSVNKSGNLWASPWSMSQANSWINASIANRSAGSIASVIASRSRVTMRLRIPGWSPLAAPSPGSRPARTPPHGWLVVRLRRNDQP